MSDLTTEQIDTRAVQGEQIPRGGLLGYRTLLLGLAGCLAPLGLLWLLLHYRPEIVTEWTALAVLGAIVTASGGTAGFHSWVKVAQARGVGGGK